MRDKNNIDLSTAKPLPPFKRELREAIRSGAKTQTRRVIKKQPTRTVSEWANDVEPGERVMLNGWPHDIRESNGRDKRDAGDLTPYKVKPLYQPGDIVYLKEPLQVRHDSSPASGYDGPQSPLAFYKDDDTPVYHNRRKLPWRWKANHLTSIQFPREAARWFGRIKSVRVERVQEISEADARAEGAPDSLNPVWPIVAEYHPIDAFQIIFDACHPGAWDANAWVWVYEWEVVNA